jgi:hypothetical protein
MNSATPVLAPNFSEIVQLIESARHRTTQAVNVALIDLYWHALFE